MQILCASSMPKSSHIKTKKRYEFIIFIIYHIRTTANGAAMCALVTIMIAHLHISVAVYMRTLLDRNTFSSSSNGQVAARRATGLILGLLSSFASIKDIGFASIVRRRHQSLSQFIIIMIVITLNICTKRADSVELVPPSTEQVNSDFDDASSGGGANKEVGAGRTTK